MKRKRNESTNVSNKILCLQNGSNVEVQLEDGKWHAGIITQCQSRKYLVQVEQQQYWIDSDLIRPNTVLDQKRNVSFEYRPGQFLRNETKSTNKIVSDEKVSSSPPDSSSISPQIESSNDSKKKRGTRTTNTEQKKSSFVWKPSTISTVQTRRSSKSNHVPEEIPPVDNHCRTRTLSNTNQQKTTAVSNSVKPSTEGASSEVLIFRPVIRFVESTTNGQSTNDSTSPKRHCSTDDENQLRNHRHSKEDDYPEILTNSDLNYHINASTDSRSSSTTSTDNPFAVNHYTIEQQIKSEPKSSCFLETPPPSLPDIHVTQDSESTLDKPLQQLKSKRKQDRPQRKAIQFKQQQEQINGVLNQLVLKQKEEEDLSKTSNDLCDPGYLSDEYSEPMASNNDSLTYSDFENLLQRLEQIDQQTDDEFNSNHQITDDEKFFSQQLITYLHNNLENYQKLDQYRSESYNDDNNQRLGYISKILQRIFTLCYQRNLVNLFQIIPDEIKTHIKLCLNNIQDQNLTKKKIFTRGKRLTHFVHLKHRTMKTKKSSINHLNESSTINEQQMLLSPASPLTPSSAKISEQQTMIEELLSPNNNQLIQSGNVIEALPALPKERDIYEVIHCLCNCEIDNGFMIQCEACLCWSHCECVGVTATCIPAFFKCNICTKAEAERAPQWSISSTFDDETTALFLTTSNNSERVALFLSYSRRLWNLREQMIELKLRYTPRLRSLQSALRCDDLVELYNYATVKSDQLTAKIQEREINRDYFQTIAHTIHDIVDSVCSSASTSECLCIELPRKTEAKTRIFNEQTNILISHLCDDDDTRNIRLSIQNRYEQLMSTVDNKIQAILHEHENIQTQMAFELGIIPTDLSDSYLSYDTHELALRTAIERLKC